MRPFASCRLPLLCLVAAASAGCVPKADLASTPPLESQAWSAPAPRHPAAIADLATAFGSPELAAYVARARAANPDLLAALARIRRARAALREAGADAQPVITPNLSLQAVGSDDSGGSDFQFSPASAGLDISWEVDLFGRLAAGRRAERARLAAAAFDADAMALVIEAEIARALVAHAALAARIEWLDRNLVSARELERVIQVRERLGATTRVETGLQSTEVRQLEVERTRLVEAQRRTRTALAVLAGDEAPLFAAPLTSMAELSLPAVAAVQPAELLVRRADLRAAEARIAASAGDVQVARKAFLPQLRLSTSGLAQAASLTGPVGATLAIGADLLGAIFNRGRLHAQLDSATATQHEAVQLYRGALLQALREAEDALAGTEQSRRRAALLDQAVEEARVTARLARIQYLEGYADLQRVLEAQERLIALEDARLIATQEQMEAAIDLYRAMGGAFAGPGPAST
jgi:outer membrane protein, multidrug efflux system